MFINMPQDFKTTMAWTIVKRVVFIKPTTVLIISNFVTIVR